MHARTDATAPGQDDLFTEEVSLLLPARMAVEGKLLGSTTRQQAVPSIEAICRLKPFTVRRVGGFETTLSNGQTLIILSGKTATKLDADLILLVPDAQHPTEIKEALERGEGRWLRPTPLNPALVSVPDMTARLAAVTVSWDDAFHLREGRAAVDGKPAVPGLRRPQIGALHAALAHATRSTEPATIVMPTGTGKTETMLALNARQQFDRLLVVVPTDALREQIAGKFETFGVLKRRAWTHQPTIPW